MCIKMFVHEAKKVAEMQRSLDSKKFQSHHRHVTACEKVKRIERNSVAWKECNNEERPSSRVMTKLCDSF